ncbi:MAG TPA: MerR family transcriptional regulator [Mycobacteriales bacterium]|nr:MerR family transcriptional regulator [Mycobacteriales bacterium]
MRSEQDGTWRVGELAERTGLTVRTLHHYDQLGLLAPSSRTSGGHRSYTGDDVARLHRIIALRSCGLSLEQIGEALSSEADGGLGELLRRQLGVVDDRIRQAVALRVRLLGVLDALARMDEPSTTDILELIEETTTMTQPLTAEQFEQLAEKRAHQVQEMSTETFNALKQKLRESWAALSREEQARLIGQRRATLPASTGGIA